MKRHKVQLGLSLGVCLLAAVANAQTNVATAQPNTFQNPLLPTGPDPWVTSADGFYYYMNTTGRDLTVWKTKDITDLAHAAKKVVWTPPPGKPYSHELWAPELHQMDGRWYIYFAADAGNNRTHRIYVVENPSRDPLEGNWTFQGEVSDSTDKWAIDATVFQNRGRWYLLWSGWEGDTNGEQRIYIAQLKNPWTVGSARVMLSRPQYPWERVNVTPGRSGDPKIAVNEGPEILQHDGKVFLVYSGSACWTDDYELGALEANADANLLDPKSWQKFDHPFFKQDAAAQAFATGHNGFFKSPDGKEDWIIYHANPKPGEGCGGTRAPRIQRFTWNADGTPDFGKPAPLNSLLTKPSR